MKRDFLIYSAADRTCTVKKADGEVVRTFQDIVEAINYVQEQRGCEKLNVTIYGPLGKDPFVIFI